MKAEDRLRAVSAFGFTDRQAGFLVTVMQHSGVCLGRHYCAFSGLTHGQKVHDFFTRLLETRMASAHGLGHNRARLYRVHHKALYQAIGEADNRFRKPVALPRAIERLMVLDAVIADRSLTWLGTERDKVAYFTARVARKDLPALTFRSDDEETVRFFPDKLPIGVTADGMTHVFLYLITRPVPVDFRQFLERHAELLRGLPTWTIRLLIPCHLADATPNFEAAFREHLAWPLNPTAFEELRWLFETRRVGGRGNDERFSRALSAFKSPRFQTLYRLWVEQGDAVLDATLSPVLADAVRRRTGRLESHVLPHRYLHLFPLVGTA